jgi:hypothetical protein
MILVKTAEKIHDPKKSYEVCKSHRHKNQAGLSLVAEEFLNHY